MALVMCRIVDEDLDRSMRRARLRDARTQSRNIGHVDMLKVRGEPLAGQLPRARRVPASSLISKKTTVDVWRAKWRTIAAPIPGAPPETRTTLLARSG
jgi:hypothetical protein